MRHILFSLSIFVILLTSGLIILGYDGTQIRDYLLGVTAVLTLATRLIKPPTATDKPAKKSESTAEGRERRLSDRSVEAEYESDAGKQSDSAQSS